MDLDDMEIYYTRKQNGLKRNKRIYKKIRKKDI